MTPQFIPFRARNPLPGALMVCLWTLLIGAPGAPAAELWKAEAELRGTPEGSRFPSGSLVFTLDRDALEALVARAPSADDALDRTAPRPRIHLPMPDGTWEPFDFNVARTMSAGLAAKYPEIRAFAGIGRDSSWRLRFELTPKGFTAAVWTPDGKVAIEPLGAADRYATAFMQDLLPEPGNDQPPICQVEEDPEVVRELTELNDRLSRRGGGVSHGSQLLTFRTAICATGEYTAQHGGTVAGGLAQIVTVVNRLNQIMGEEWSVALELVPNNDRVVYTNPATDPFTNGQIFTMLGESQQTLNLRIGSGNYDHGHVFGTGPGGVASLGSVCRSTSKGRGVSTLFSTGGEQFNLLAAHEMGHQFACAHTFNGNEGNCLGNRSGNSAYEPGSGTTIMSYAGSCGSQDIKSTSDDYYHTHSFSQAVNYITAGFGATCAALTPTGNTPPVSVAGNAGLTIPIDTPFSLTGTGTDADGDPVKYSWEQYDLGPAGHPDMPVGNAPLFRSRRPKTVPERVFPRIQEVLSGTPRIGEILPTYARNMTFRLSVRDELGGMHWDATTIGVDDLSGPFRVTSHSTSETLSAGSQITVTWDVAGTTNPPVSCANVNILIAADGKTYDNTLASSTPNDGSEMVTVPALVTTTARIKVEAADNVFFDLNDADLTITAATSVEPIASAPGLRLEPARPNPFRGNTSISYAMPAEGRVSLKVYDAGGRLVRVLHDGPAAQGEHSISWDGTGHEGKAVASGIYFLRLDTDAGEGQMQKVQLLR